VWSPSLSPPARGITIFRPRTLRAASRPVFTVGTTRGRPPHPPAVAFAGRRRGCVPRSQRPSFPALPRIAGHARPCARLASCATRPEYSGLAPHTHTSNVLAAPRALTAWPRGTQAHARYRRVRHKTRTRAPPGRPPRVRAVNNPQPHPLPRWGASRGSSRQRLWARYAARNTYFASRNRPNYKFSQIRIRYPSIPSISPKCHDHPAHARQPPSAIACRARCAAATPNVMERPKTPCVSPTPQARATDGRTNASAQRRRREPRTGEQTRQPRWVPWTPPARRQPPECHFGVRPMT